MGIYPEKTIIQKGTCTPVFIAALFTVAKERKQPKCPSTDEWIKKIWYRQIDRHTHTMQYCSDIKKEWNNANYSSMDGPRNYPTKWSKPGKDKYHMI